MMRRTISGLEIEPLEDPNRVSVYAELTHEAPAPSEGIVTADATMQIWIGDNPTFEQLQLRVIDTLSRSFELSPELREELGAVYTSNKLPLAQTNRHSLSLQEKGWVCDIHTMYDSLGMLENDRMLTLDRKNI